MLILVVYFHLDISLDTRQTTSKDEHDDASTTIVLSQFNRTTLTVVEKKSTGGEN